VKAISNIDVSIHRKAQDGRFSFENCGKSYDIRTSSVPTVNGESVVMRILDKEADGRSYGELGTEGYSGRVGVFELLKVTSDLVRMKQHEIEDKVIYDYIRKTQPDYSDIYENAKKLIREGTTTSEEVMRVLGEVNIDSGRR